VSSPKEHESPRKLLVVDDDEQIRKQIQWALAGDYEVFAANDRDDAIGTFQSEDIPVVLLDLGLPPKPRDASEGLATLDAMLEENPHAKVIIVSGNAERQNAVSAVQRGAHDIFPKPLDLDQLRVVLARAHTKLELELELESEATSSSSEAVDAFPEFVGRSDRMREVFEMIEKVAARQIPVLITGESGTGKECTARALHESNSRREGPFVAINCGAIPENLLESELFGHEKGAFTGADAKRIGKIECANGGTLFLDEIGEMSAPLQVKLLRFLQERVIERVGGRESIPIDTRVIAATNLDIDEAIRDGRFREDLYFRLAVLPIVLPPLRERGDDMILLANHFVERYCKELSTSSKKLSAAALTAIRAHPWPGNVRELQNRVQRAVLLSESATIHANALHLDTSAPAMSRTAGLSLKEAKDELEREMVREALKANGGNISKTSRTLGISRPTLYDMISKHELPTNGNEPDSSAASKG